MLPSDKKVSALSQPFLSKGTTPDGTTEEDVAKKS